MMKPMRWVTLAVTLLGLTIAAAGRAEADVLLGNDFGGILYNVNTSTGAASSPRSTGTAFLAGIAFRSDGALFGLTTVSGNPGNSLVSINPTTGATTTVGPVNLGTVLEGDLTFDNSTGTLYGMYISGSKTLFTLNTSTGAGTAVGNMTSLDDPSGITFDKAGNLLVLDSGISTGLTRLAFLNKTNGQVLSTVALSRRLGAVVGMAVDSSGTIYVADGESSGTDNLYTLNETTGALTLVGPTGLPAGLAGLAFAPQVVPEPGPMALAAVGGLIAVAVTRLRRTPAA